MTPHLLLRYSASRVGSQELHVTRGSVQQRDAQDRKLRGGAPLEEVLSRRGGLR
jgi:hypothetical protein